jgi:N-acyl homoserine lactone hydrolase
MTATRMWALDGPTITLDAGILLIGGQGDVTIPIPVFLIEHPRGLVLFDTGMVPEAHADPFAVYGNLANDFKMTGGRELRVDSQLAALGFSPEDVTHVILSHSHWDHAGGISMFPHATFYVGEGELRYGFWPDVVGRGFFRASDLEPLRSCRVVEIPRCDVDLFGDGSLVILFTPGHTPGELSLIVRLTENEFLLTGDVVHLREGIERVIAMPYDADTVEAVRSIQRLQIIGEATQAKIWIPHDPQDWKFYKRAPHVYE